MTRPDFSLNPIAALVVAYNTVAEHVAEARPVSKFSDRATAVKRLNAIIDQVEAAGFEVSYLPNGAIADILSPKESKIADQEAQAALDAGDTGDYMGEPPALLAPTPTASVGGLTTLELEHRIEVLVANPKRSGSRAHAVFSLYRTGMTGEDFVTAVIRAGHDRRVALSNLHWDIDHGFIYLGEDAGEKR